MTETLETVPCNCCGGEGLLVVYRMPDTQFHRDEWFSVVECRTCGLGFVNPRPRRENMARFYPPEYYDYFEKEQTLHERRYAEQAQFLAGIPQAAGSAPRLLDVGCARGDFPRFMQARGWEVVGVEPSDAALEIDEFPIFRGELPDLPDDPRGFDAVTAWAVLEHVHDPAAYFRKAATVLRPGGVFVFLVTNFDSLASRRLFQEDVPRHLYFFTEPTVRRYVDRAGLVLESADYSDRVYGMHPVNWLVYLLAYRSLRRRFEWEDAQNGRAAWLAARGLDPTASAKARFALAHPLVTLDRVLARPFAALEQRRRRYGIVTYRARKPA